MNKPLSQKAKEKLTKPELVEIIYAMTGRRLSKGNRKAELISILNQAEIKEMLKPEMVGGPIPTVPESSTNDGQFWTGSVIGFISGIVLVAIVVGVS